MVRNSERGSAIFMLFIAVALFGLVSFAFLHNSRSSTSMVQNVQQDAQTTQSLDCSNSKDIALKRLRARGCGTLISYYADGSAVSGGPSDGSCSMYHSNGGGIKDCDGTAIPVGGGGPPPDPEDCLDTLGVGQSCVGAVYAGVVGSNRIYAAPTDLASATWNNGSGTMPNIPGATSATNGKANTDAILLVASGSPYNAAANCRALGPKWYLPAPAELQLLEDVKNTGSFNGTFNTSGGGASRYWSSRQLGAADEAAAVRLVDGTVDNRDKNESLRVRCIRQE